MCLQKARISILLYWSQTQCLLTGQTQCLLTGQTQCLLTGQNVTGQNNNEIICYQLFKS
jgi:hypothetical protein